MIAGMTLKGGLLAVVSSPVLAGVLLVGSRAGAAASSRDVTIPVRARETDLADAFAILRSLGLRVAIDHSTSYSTLASAWVARLSPPVGTRVSSGTVVTITPSDHGPLGSPAVLKSHPRYRVPRFIGKTAATAIGWANSHYMFWRIPRLPALPASNAQRLFAAYRVTAQTPKPGGAIVQGVMIGKSFKPTPLTLTVQR